MEVGLGPGDWDPAAPPQKSPPIFGIYLLWQNGWMSSSGWIKIALGIEVGLGPDHTVIDGDPASSPKIEQSAPPHLGPFLLSPNGCMYQDTTWYGGRPQPRQHCVRRVLSSPSLKEHSPQFLVTPL